MVERLYPGVYVTEIPFDAKPIEGVPTTSPHAEAARAPPWPHPIGPSTGRAMRASRSRSCSRGSVNRRCSARTQPRPESTESAHRIRKP